MSLLFSVLYSFSSCTFNYIMAVSNGNEKKKIQSKYKNGNQSSNLSKTCMLHSVPDRMILVYENTMNRLGQERNVTAEERMVLECTASTSMNHKGIFK